MDTTAAIPTDDQPRFMRALGWLALSALIAVFAFQLVSNHIDTGFHDRARDVVSVQTLADGSSVAYDAKGRIVENPDANNPIDDVIKVFVVFLAAAAFQQAMWSVVHRRWVSVSVTVVAVIVGVPAVFVWDFFAHFGE